jgi:hypothetical protein
MQGWANTNKAARLLGQETTQEGGQELFIHYIERQ